MQTRFIVKLLLVAAAPATLSLACNGPSEGASTTSTDASKASGPSGPADANADIPAPPDVAAPPADAEKTASGLAFKILEPGKGPDTPRKWDSVEVHYTGWTTDGKMFDSSRKRGRPATFPLKAVIAGWTEGMQLMTTGEKRRFWIPTELAYNNQPGKPQGMLVFDVELLSIRKGPEPIPAPPDVAAAPADAIKTASGLQYKVLTKGTQKTKPDPWDRVEVHYTGWTTNGDMFDSSKQRQKPASFAVTGVIPGWTEALQLMSPGDSMRIWIPADLAYGDTPQRPGAPAGPLTFEVELLQIMDQPKPPDTPKDVAAAPADAKKTASGLAYKVLSKGKGKAHPAATDQVEVHYTGWTTDGNMFDSSVTRGKPATFFLNRVIPGWTEGVQLMVEGEKTRFWIPGALAYGDTPRRPGAPAGTLVFDVELIKILKGTPAGDDAHAGHGH